MTRPNQGLSLGRGKSPGTRLDTSVTGDLTGTAEQLSDLGGTISAPILMGGGGGAQDTFSY